MLYLFTLYLIFRMTLPVLTIEHFKNNKMYNDMPIIYSYCFIDKYYDKLIFK